MTPRCPPHCGHRTGTSTHHWSAGGDEVVCCFCGKRSTVVWTVDTEPLNGHGPHYTIGIRSDTWPDGWEDGR